MDGIDSLQYCCIIFQLSFCLFSSIGALKRLECLSVPSQLSRSKHIFVLKEGDSGCQGDSAIGRVTILEETAAQNPP